jgi:DnaJ-class molecular chaperone
MNLKGGRAMDTHIFSVGGKELVVEVRECKGGGYMVMHHLDEVGAKCTSSVTCFDSQGNSYYFSKECRSCSGNEGDCSDPKHPKIRCG